MLLYPRLYLESVKQITIQMLEQNNIKGLILDVDNTLIDFDKNMPEGIKEWANNMKENGIKLCILQISCIYMWGNGVLFQILILNK